MHDDDTFLIERIELELGTVVEIRQEEYQADFDPRENYEHVGTMVYFGNDYTWGDEQAAHNDARTCLEESPEIVVAKAIWFDDRRYDATCYEVDDVADANGLIYVTEEKLRAEYGNSPDSIEHAKSCLEGEIEEYASYLEGEVYWWRITHPCVDWLENAAVETGCGGYVGDLEYVKSEAKEAGEYSEQQYAKELREQAEWRARDVVTV